jgi:hypothetical protein
MDLAYLSFYSYLAQNKEEMHIKLMNQTNETLSVGLCERDGARLLQN